MTLLPSDILALTQGVELDVDLYVIGSGRMGKQRVSLKQKRRLRDLELAEYWTKGAPVTPKWVLTKKGIEMREDLMREMADV